MTKRQHGFTLTELIVSMTVASILSLVMITISVYFYADIIRQQAVAELAIESQSTLRRLVEDIRTADAIRDTNEITDANSPVGGWQTSDPNNVIIIATPVVDSNRQIIYNSDDGFPYENELVYFGSGNTIARRTLKNTAATGNIAVTSCPAAQVTPTCPQDIILSPYLENLVFVFYDINNAVTTSAASARSVAITLNLKRKVYGREITFSNTVRTTLRNY
jgi:prepilin-type N-terminal cleavage/methylation domain-containing protein